MKLRDYSETTPIQYEEGKTVFMGMEIMVDPRVLIPRPETELLVKKTAETAMGAGMESPRILEIGTGSGVIALGLTKLMSGCSVISADISEEALQAAAANIEARGAGERIKLVRSDMFSVFGYSYRGVFDIIVSNPPYVSDKDYSELDAWVRAEPEVALRAGSEGMDHLRTLAEEAPTYLRNGGFLAVEIGYDQADKVKNAFRTAGLKDIRSFVDLNGYERVITGVKRG